MSIPPSTPQIAANIYAGRDWHQLSEQEKELVKALEAGGFLKVNTPANGFVGGMMKQ